MRPRSKETFKTPGKRKPNCSVEPRHETHGTSERCRFSRRPQGAQPPRSTLVPMAAHSARTSASPSREWRSRQVTRPTRSGPPLSSGSPLSKTPSAKAPADSPQPSCQAHCARWNTDLLVGSLAAASARHSLICLRPSLTNGSSSGHRRRKCRKKATVWCTPRVTTSRLSMVWRYAATWAADGRPPSALRRAKASRLPTRSS
mmetsp:Transcript_110741/g.300531  ORF Transcript_110741/g.300531 Transcript_110741/m.300531 type:complete len:202 (+) Transcript_110741:214-819(+)